MTTKRFRSSNVRQSFIRGLLESGCCCSIVFTGSLKAAGFERSHTDPCMFRGFVHREAEAYIDVLWTITSALHQLSGSWRAPWQNGAHNSRTNEDFGDLTYFVGRHISRHQSQKELRLDQHTYIWTIAERCEVTEMMKLQRQVVESHCRRRMARARGEVTRRRIVFSARSKPRR